MLKKIIKYSVFAILGIAIWAFIAIFFYTADASAQSAPDVVVNAESPQGSTVENQDLNNLYQQQTNTQNTVSTLYGQLANVVNCSVGQLVYIQTKGTLGCGQYGTSGQLLESQGNGLPPIWAAPPTAHGIQVFTSSGTFIAPTGITIVTVTLVGGGGSGSSGNNSSASGGSGAGFIINYPFTVTPGGNYTVTIGAGGSGGNINPGNNGGTTSFSTLSVPGGVGGLTTNSTNPGGGGYSSGSGYSIQGGTGAAGNAGLGGGTAFGQGGSSQGASGTGYGSGGAAGTTSSQAGAGTSGLVIVQY